MKHLLMENTHFHATLSSGQVVPDGCLWVQCGNCSKKCPIGIDVYMHVWTNKSIQDSHCPNCGECGIRCFAEFYFLNEQICLRRIRNDALHNHRNRSSRSGCG